MWKQHTSTISVTMDLKKKKNGKMDLVVVVVVAAVAVIVVVYKYGQNSFHSFRWRLNAIPSHLHSRTKLVLALDICVAVHRNFSVVFRPCALDSGQQYPQIERERGE